MLHCQSLSISCSWTWGIHMFIFPFSCCTYKCTCCQYLSSYSWALCSRHNSLAFQLSVPSMISLVTSGTIKQSFFTIYASKMSLNTPAIEILFLVKVFFSNWSTTKFRFWSLNLSRWLLQHTLAEIPTWGKIFLIWLAPKTLGPGSIRQNATVLHFNLK
jgi:hypothetical protein